MNNEELQDKLGELIYELSEINFDCITDEFFQKHINSEEPFTEKQIETLKVFLDSFIYDQDELLETPLEEGAHDYVFNINGHKWSNNDNTAGDNYKSFIDGAKWLFNKLKA